MFLAGSVLDQLPGRKYTASLRFFEFAPRSPWPRAATFTRMQHQLPKGVMVALRAPTDAIVGGRGPLRVDDAVRAGRDAFLEAAECLGACAIVLQTPADLTPGARSADLLAAYVEEIPRAEGRHIVWAPRGAWEAEHSAALATRLGLVCAYDPVFGTRPPGPVVYARLVAAGYQHHFSEATLEDTVAQIMAEPFDQAFVSIDSDRSFKQADLLQRIADAAQPN